MAVRAEAPPRAVPARLAAVALVALSATAASPPPGRTAGEALEGRVAARLEALPRQGAWRQVAAIPLRFRTFHPQGLVKVGTDFFLSSVEVREQPKASAGPGGGRTPGAGVGHLFRFGADGALRADLHLGEGAAYHPGGIDFDGRSIWVPVSEYRPDSRAIVYRVDPIAMTAAEAFRFDDHVGALAFDRSRGELRGLSWGSRRLYRWRLRERAPGAAGWSRATTPTTPNRFGYIDYQDCHYVGDGRMLCGGLADSGVEARGERTEIGGLELVDLGDDRPVWQAPVALRSPGGRLMTQNPVWVEATATGLRAYFIPDDDASTLYVYET